MIKNLINVSIVIIIIIIVKEIINPVIACIN